MYQMDICNVSHFFILCQTVDSKNKPFRELKGQIHELGFTPLGCDLNRISLEFSDLIFTTLLERYLDSPIMKGWVLVL
jgi:hypothetical protein